MRGAQEKVQLGAELGLGGLFKGISNLLDVVSKMAEEKKEEYISSGSVEELGGNLKAVYGLSVRMGLGGKPIIEQFGNVRESEEGSMVAETREPLVDILDEGDRLVVIAELPGAEAQDLRVRLEGDVLEIAASTGGRNYQKEVLLPAAVEPGSLKTSYRNGVLEVALVKE